MKHHTSPDGVNARLSPLAFHFRDWVPLKGESPVKTSDHWLICLHVKLKGVPVNGVDNGAHNGTGILSNPKNTARKQGEKGKDNNKNICLIYIHYLQISRLSCSSTYLSSRGSIQPGTHSQWQSRNVSTSPVAKVAPMRRARTRPSLLLVRMSRTRSRLLM